jgi:hypothetical protein
VFAFFSALRRRVKAGNGYPAALFPVKAPVQNFRQPAPPVARKLVGKEAQAGPQGRGDDKALSAGSGAGVKDDAAAYSLVGQAQGTGGKNGSVIQKIGSFKSFGKRKRGTPGEEAFP